MSEVFYSEVTNDHRSNYASNGKEAWIVSDNLIKAGIAMSIGPLLVGTYAFFKPAYDELRQTLSEVINELSPTANQYDI